jgi:hypothetical protein|nr:MAG TPA: hypothetical protein [Caudoviricetes sp.]
MATITWQQDNCRIVRLDVGDIYTNERGFRFPVLVKQYLLLAGTVKMNITQCNEGGNHVHVLIPSNIKHDVIPVVLNAYKPCPSEWWDVICDKINPNNRVPDIKEIEYAVDQPQLSVIDEPMFTLKDIILTGLTVAAAVFGIMR